MRYLAHENHDFPGIRNALTVYFALDKRGQNMQQPLTQAERNARLAASNKKRGLVQVKIWIPVERSQELRDIAARMREQLEMKL